MKLLDLFSGTGSVSHEARRLGWETVSLDIDDRHAPVDDSGALFLHVSILDWDYKEYPPGTFQFIWASPCCRLYSIARVTAHQSADLDEADKLVAKTREIVEYFGAPYAIENPATSRLWLRSVAKDIPYRTLTSYCCWGFPYRKAVSYTHLTLPTILRV